ncbi:hypothetical protein BKA69DRAFT_1040812 [Paraphysoderma sedebokerense]|nr:hypothetical protein BKA69DRAFT_1040812 [Paraphysoderma sedebokerense]
MYLKRFDQKLHGHFYPLLIQNPDITNYRLPSGFTVVTTVEKLDASHVSPPVAMGEKLQILLPPGEYPVDDVFFLYMHAYGFPLKVPSNKTPWQLLASFQVDHWTVDGESMKVVVAEENWNLNVPWLFENFGPPQMEQMPFPDYMYYPEYHGDYHPMMEPHPEYYPQIAPPPVNAYLPPPLPPSGGPMMRPTPIIPREHIERVFDLIDHSPTLYVRPDFIKAMYSDRYHDKLDTSLGAILSSRDDLEYVALTGKKVLTTKAKLEYARSGLHKCTKRKLMSLLMPSRYSVDEVLKCYKEAYGSLAVPEGESVASYLHNINVPNLEIHGDTVLVARLPKMEELYWPQILEGSLDSFYQQPSNRSASTKEVLPENLTSQSTATPSFLSSRSRRNSSYETHRHSDRSIAKPRRPLRLRSIDNSDLSPNPRAALVSSLKRAREEAATANERRVKEKVDSRYHSTSSINDTESPSSTAEPLPEKVSAEGQAKGMPTSSSTIMSTTTKTSDLQWVPPYVNTLQAQAGTNNPSSFMSTNGQSTPPLMPFFNPLLLQPGSIGNSQAQAQYMQLMAAAPYLLANPSLLSTLLTAATLPTPITTPIPTATSAVPQSCSNTPSSSRPSSPPIPPTTSMPCAAIPPFFPPAMLPPLPTFPLPTLPIPPVSTSSSSSSTPPTVPPTTAVSSPKESRKSGNATTTSANLNGNSNPHINSLLANLKARIASGEVVPSGALNSAHNSGNLANHDMGRMGMKFEEKSRKSAVDFF